MTETPGEAVAAQPGPADGSIAGPDVSKSTLSPDATLLTAREAADASAETRAGPGGRPATDPTGSAFSLSGDTGNIVSKAMPKSFGRYRIDKVLGEGAMGAVYLAYDTQLDRKIALKIPKLDAAEGREVIERFFREARAAANLRNAYICPVYDVGEIDGQCYITMAFIEGRPLKDFITPTKFLAEKQIVSTIRKLAAGLGEAHKSGVIHRDLKPANIMIDKKGEPVVMDFGLARKTNGEEEHLTKTGSIVGTPAYMSPEQVEGIAVLGPPTDVYSLGVIFYEMLTQRRPFEGSLLSILTQIGSKEPPKPTTLREGLNPRLEQICLKMMAKQVSDRYATMEAVARDLASSLKPTEGSTATPAASVAAVNDAPVAENTVPKLAPVIQTEPRGRSRSGQKQPPRPAWWMSPFAWGGFGVVLLLGAIIITITNRDGSKVVIKAEDDATIEVAREARPATRQETQPGHAVTKWQGWPADAPRPAIAPFDAAQARQHQEEWAAYLKLPVEYTNSVGMKFRLIPPGEFLMGGTPEEIEAALQFAGDDKNWQDWCRSEAPRHKVVLTQPFFLSVCEVTQKEWEAVMKTNPSHFAPTGMGKEAVMNLETATHPVESVSWNDAAEYCAKLSQQELLKPFYFRAGETVTSLDGTGYRLPTEAQWEFACRAGTATKYWIGDTDDDLVRAGWHGMNSGERTHAVGELQANPFGLHDTHGNVHEWVRDWYEPAYFGQFAEKTAVDPSGPSSQGSDRLFRGGFWANGALFCRAAIRRRMPPGGWNSYVGFRLALSVDAVRQLRKVASMAAGAPPPAIAPFDAAAALRHQEAWAAHLKVPVEYANSIGMRFRLIPPGEFMMGSTPEEIDAALKHTGDDKNWQGLISSEGPRHKVVLTQAIYLSVHEVTQQGWEAVMKTNPSHFAPTGLGKEVVANQGTATHPVETVNWYDAVDYCIKLSHQENLKPFYFRSGETVTPLEGTGYRLPTEAEWEFACRAGTASRYCTGDTDDDLQRAGWNLTNAGRQTHAVGGLQMNPFGLHDMHGNALEWVQDGYDPAHYQQFAEKAAVNPSGPWSPGSLRVCRGGCWFSWPWDCWSASRRALSLTNQNSTLGFRLALIPVASARGAATPPSH